MESKNVDFIGIGASRSGTTWVFECLLKHPDFCGSDTKEVNELNQPEFNLPRYFTHFAHCGPQKITGEYSSEYMYSEDAAKRIKTYFPSAKLLICLRRPIERLVSHYYFMRSREHHEVRATLEKHLEDDPWGEIRHGRYAEYIQMWFKYFPKNQILILLNDDERENNPEAFIRKIYQFLGLRDDFVPRELFDKRFKVTALNKTRVPGLKRVLFGIRALLKESSGGRAIETLLKALKIHIFVKHIIEWNFRGDLDKDVRYFKKEPLSKEWYDKLRVYYEEDNKKLENLLGIKLPDNWFEYPVS